MWCMISYSLLTNPQIPDVHIGVENRVLAWKKGKKVGWGGIAPKCAQQLFGYSMYVLYGPTKILLAEPLKLLASLRTFMPLLFQNMVSTQLNVH